MEKDTQIDKNEPEGMRPNQKGRLTGQPGKTEQSGKERGRMGSAPRGRDTAAKSAASKVMSRTSTVGDETDEGGASRQTSDASNCSGQA